MRIAVITANLGNFDQVHELPPQTIEFDRHYITDKNNPVPSPGVDNRLRAKIFKLIPHVIWPDYDIYVWIDANVKIKSKTFIEELTKPMELELDFRPDFVIAKHPARTDIYQEAAFIINSLKRNDRYLKARYDITAMQKEMEMIGPDLKDQGLYYCGIFARHGKGYLNGACEQWYLDNVLWSNFDQINFINMVYCRGLTIHPFKFGQFADNDYYQLTKHNIIG